MPRSTDSGRPMVGVAACLALGLTLVAGGADGGAGANPTLDATLKRAEAFGNEALAWYRRTPPVDSGVPEVNGIKSVRISTVRPLSRWITSESLRPWIVLKLNVRMSFETPSAPRRILRAASSCSFESRKAIRPAK